MSGHFLSAQPRQMAQSLEEDVNCNFARLSWSRSQTTGYESQQWSFPHSPQVRLEHFLSALTQVKSGYPTSHDLRKPRLHASPIDSCNASFMTHLKLKRSRVPSACPHNATFCCCPISRYPPRRGERMTDSLYVVIPSFGERVSVIANTWGRNSAVDLEGEGLVHVVLPTPWA